MVEERVFCVSSAFIGVALRLEVVPVQIENILKNLLFTLVSCAVIVHFVNRNANSVQ